jgi:hypothetical protein
MRDDKETWFQRERRISFRNAKLKQMIRSGVLQPATSKAMMRREIEVMTAGCAITRVPYGACTSLYAWSDRKTDLQGW